MTEEPRAEPSLPPDTLARYPLRAWLPDRDRAIAALEDLRAAGFADEDAVLWLEAESEAADRVPGRDRELFLVVARDSLAGTYLGAFVGALLGILIALLPPVRDAAGGASLRMFAIAAVLGAVAGIFGGSLLGMTAALDRQRAGSDTYADQLPEDATLLLLAPRSDEQEDRALATIARMGGRPAGRGAGG
ncbi:MAG TPA: hypothetical protein VKV26_04560 [Dehalococcoidia bacterium]|nr:hypothetical protein [Dehalococcoidia bacterium]